MKLYFPGRPAFSEYIVVTLSVELFVFGFLAIIGYVFQGQPYFDIPKTAAICIFVALVSTGHYVHDWFEYRRSMKELNMLLGVVSDKRGE